MATMSTKGRFFRVFKHTGEKCVKIALLPEGQESKWDANSASQAAEAIIATGLPVDVWSVWITDYKPRKGAKTITAKQFAASVAAAAEVKWLIFWAKTKTGRSFPSPKLVISHEVYRKPAAKGSTTEDLEPGEPMEVDL